MADKDYSQLTAATSAGDTDLVAIYPVGGPLKKLTFATFVSQVVASLGSTFLTTANNLSDLASASSARANLGLGTAAQLASSALFQVANNFSEVSNAATARTNIGAAASASPVFTGGITQSGSSKFTPQALAALAIDFSAADVQTKSISVDSTFTFSNLTAGKAQSVSLFLTISGGAKPIWPAGVKFGGGTDFSAALGNGSHELRLATPDGSTVIASVVNRAYV